jgi:3',5'-cyclic AMP phosphodiesterase CpdA
VAVRVLHLSDLHFGSKGGEIGGPGLEQLIERAEPELIVVSGDLANRGRREQIAQSAELLRSLGPEVVAVPGNHDLPYTFPGRFTHPWREFERQWATTEPIHRSDRLLVVGLNSARGLPARLLAPSPHLCALASTQAPALGPAPCLANTRRSRR